MAMFAEDAWKERVKFCWNGVVVRREDLVRAEPLANILSKGGVTDSAPPRQFEVPTCGRETCTSQKPAFRSWPKAGREQQNVKARWML
jgi:hypothetical protein